MIGFVVVAAPRSGTAWAANWLCTEHTLCIHDPFWRYDLPSLETMPSGKQLGIACTGVALFPEWLDQSRARTVVLHREISEINASLERMGLDPIPTHWQETLGNVRGMHVDWMDLFKRPEAIWQHLVPGVPFDPERHRELVNFNVQMDFEHLDPDPAVVKRMLERLHA